PVRTRATEAATAVDRAGHVRTLTLAFPARDVAVHWAGQPDAVVTLETSADGVTFGPPVDAGRDEVGEQRDNGETYGALVPAGGATVVRVTSDRPLARLTVMGLADGARAVRHVRVHGAAAGASVAQPTVIPRSGWGADESLRYDSTGNEVWPPAFYPVQKLIVHHTA